MNPNGCPEFVSDLLPEADGLFLGETDTPRRWDGSRLVNLPATTPTVHGNSKHSQAYTDSVFLSGSYLSAADVTVGGASPTNVASVTVSISGNREEYLLPMAGFNYRPDAGNTANRTLQVWLNDGSGDRSAKFPITVVLNEAKRPFAYNLAFGSSLHVGYWQSPKTSSVTLYLRAQTDQESAICSDRFFTVLRFSRQP